MINISLFIIFIIINIPQSYSQWNNIYRYSNSKLCDQDEIPSLISNRLDVCLGSIIYTCSDQSITTETFYKNDDCVTKTTQKSYFNNICKNGQLINCTLSKVPSLPVSSFVMAVYPNDDVNCNDDSRITQYSTIPLNVCNLGLKYQCDSKSLIIEKYDDENCTTISSTSKNSLGCVHNNPFYKVLRFSCT